jgi:hypothetical protein
VPGLPGRHLWNHRRLAALLPVVVIVAQRIVSFLPRHKRCLFTCLPKTAAGATSKEKGCHDAPAGAYVDKMGQVAFQLCQPGTYQNLEGECCEVLAVQSMPEHDV